MNLFMGLHIVISINEDLSLQNVSYSQYCQTVEKDQSPAITQSVWSSRCNLCISLTQSRTSSEQKSHKTCGGSSLLF
jgi:rRNA maturation endonuclease Nob1